MRIPIFFILAGIVLLFQFLNAQVPNTLWTKTFGGTNIDVGYSVHQTADGGYIIAGYTRSFGLMSGRNVWLIKTDALGNEQWNNAFGGDNDEEAYSVRPTSDGGYILTGYTKSFGLGGNDVLLIKTDSSGNSQWIRTFGGAQDDEGYSLTLDHDGGYVIAGATSSFGAGSRDVFLIKTDEAGNLVWSRTLGGMSSDGARSVQKTSDGGFIITGWTFSYGPGYVGNAWLVKTDSAGYQQWNQAFGGSDVDRGYSVQETTDGGYVITGYTASYGAGLDDLWLIKTDSSGTLEWDKTYGGSGRDYGNYVQQTLDGGYVITGYTLSYGAGGDDLWLIKTDAGGNEEWRTTFGGSQSDVGYEVHQTADGGYIVVGHTLSSGAGMHDVYLIRLAPPAKPLFAVSPDSLWFGSILVGDTLLDSVCVNNHGTASLVIDSVASTNSFFTVSPTSGIILPDSSAYFYIQLAANAPGPQEGSIIFYHNAATSPDSIMVKADVLTELIHNEGIDVTDYVLYQNYPNPFNASTNIEFRNPKKEFVSLRIFNISGEEVATIVSVQLSAGYHTFKFNASNLPSGVYLYRLQTGSYTATKKMVVLK